MRERASAASTSSPDPGLTAGSTLPSRNRRTAVALVAWILVLVLASAVVAWLRN
jgi:hypothetical protein